MNAKKKLTDDDYEVLLEFRTGLRRFLRWSKAQAAREGITPTQHQLLLAVRGHPDHRGPTIGEIAECLLLRHHSTVELVDRAEAAGLVRRKADAEDQRRVRLALTPLGERCLEAITRSNLEELGRLGPRLRKVWEGLEE